MNKFLIGQRKRFSFFVARCALRLENWRLVWAHVNSSKQERFEQAAHHHRRRKIRFYGDASLNFIPATLKYQLHSWIESKRGKIRRYIESCCCSRRRRRV